MATHGIGHKSHIRLIDYSVMEVGVSTPKWEAPHKVGDDIVTTSMET